MWNAITLQFAVVIARPSLAVSLIAASLAAQALVPLENVAAIAAGIQHTCALTTGGGVKCWGNNRTGQLGDNSTTKRLTPADVSGLTSGVTAIAAGNDHTCAVTTGGGVKCWGDTYGQPSSAPADVAGLASGVAAIAAGYWHTCARTTAGGVKCWGNNRYGQLGNNLSGEGPTPPGDVLGLTSGVAAITAGFFHTCALTTAGGVKCWGIGGPLGDNSTTNRLTPVDVTGLTSGVAAIAAGASHTCALTSGGGVKCWGQSLNGQLGNNSIGDDLGNNTIYAVRLTPVDVVGLASGVVSIVAGAYYTCAITSAGGANCWGDNSKGQLGDISTRQRLIPVDVFGLASGVTAIATGYQHTCALITRGGVKCWGDNSSGQLGDNSTTYRPTPVDVFGLTSGVAAINVGGSHTCVLTTGHGVKCWGANGAGQLGDNSFSNSNTPADVFGLMSGVAAITGGGNHTCALTSGGGVKCWGSNFFDQLGVDPGNFFSKTYIGQRVTPVDVIGLSSGVAAIAAGNIHTCALTGGGAVKCWGYLLGDHSYTISFTPVDVIGFASGVAAIAAGGDHTCALNTGGGVQCWGGNSAGQLGNNSTTNSNTPVDVLGLTSGVAAIAVGGEHACALTRGGGVKCWGGNGAGQLGDNSTTPRLTPVDVIGLTSGVAAISAGDAYTCALTTGGGVKCWGSNGASQLGDNSTTNRLTPVNVLGLTSGATAIAAGGGHICALTTGGAVKCWGGNSAGQIGDGSGSWRTFPADVQLLFPPPGALTGLWWNANESGWGIHFTQRGSNIFAAWYTYDTTGNPKWYVASNCTGATGASGTCSGALYEVNGPAFFGATFNPNAVNVVTAGSLQVNFQNTNSASMTYTVGTQSRTVAIVRQPLGTGAIPGLDYTDPWWNPSESGWGLAIAQQAANMFLAWYVYDNNGKPVWYVASNCTVSGNGCTGTLYRTTGPPSGPTFNPALVQVITVGTVSLAFTDANNGTLTYTVNGVSGSKAITRQLF